MNKVILKVGGMSCSACSSGLEKYLNKQKGITFANVNLVLGQALIEYDDILDINDLTRFIKEAGYESLGTYDEKEEKNSKNDKISFIIFIVLAVLILYISMSHMVGLPVVSFLHMTKHPIHYAISLLILTIPFLIYGFDIFKSGIKNLIHKTPNMDTLVTIGVIASFLYSLFGLIMILIGKNEYVENLYFESSAIIIFFIKIGRSIDKRSKEKTKEAIQQLVQITPQNAFLKKKDGERKVTIDEVKIGDVLIAKPGMKIAVDGIIISGVTHLDEAFITGESLPTKKSKGDKVIAGSINYDGYIEYSATAIGKNSTISEIVRLVIEATNTKAPIARLADKVSGYFVPGIMVISIFTFIGYLLLGFHFNDALVSFVTVLVVSCPCALGLATPLAIVISEGVCAKNGILVKTSETLEQAYKIDTILFDKTGTLTYGDLRISKVFNYSRYQDDELVCIVGSIESKSTHPISKAFEDYICDKNLKIKEVTDFQNITGIGLTGIIDHKKIFVGNDKLFTDLNLENQYTQDEETLSGLGNTIIYVIEEKKVIGLIGVKDIVRDDAKKTIIKLKKLGKDVIMLTGDNHKVANIIADTIGIKKVISNVMPSEKTKVIKELTEKGKKVMMVGDGINDAPSLASASIGVSINSGADIATNSADIILIHDNLQSIPALIDISKKTIRNIKQNLFWAFFYNVCMIPLAIGFLKPFGLTMNPMVAGFSMTISSLTVVLNALRLKRWKGV